MLFIAVDAPLRNNRRAVTDQSEGSVQKACQVIKSANNRGDETVGLFLDLIKIREKKHRNETTGGCFERRRTIMSL